MNHTLPIPKAKMITLPLCQPARFTESLHAKANFLVGEQTDFFCSEDHGKNFDGTFRR